MSSAKLRKGVPTLDIRLRIEARGRRFVMHEMFGDQAPIEFEADTLVEAKPSFGTGDDPQGDGRVAIGEDLSSRWLAWRSIS